MSRRSPRSSACDGDCAPACPCDRYRLEQSATRQRISALPLSPTSPPAPAGVFSPACLTRLLEVVDLLSVVAWSVHGRAAGRFWSDRLAVGVARRLPLEVPAVGRVVVVDELDETASQQDILQRRHHLERRARPRPPERKRETPISRRELKSQSPVAAAGMSHPSRSVSPVPDIVRQLECEHHVARVLRLENFETEADPTVTSRRARGGEGTKKDDGHARHRRRLEGKQRGTVGRRVKQAGVGGLGDKIRAAANGSNQETRPNRWYERTNRERPIEAR